MRASLAKGSVALAERFFSQGGNSGDFQRPTGERLYASNASGLAPPEPQISKTTSERSNRGLAEQVHDLPISGQPRPRVVQRRSWASGIRTRFFNSKDFIGVPKVPLDGDSPVALDRGRMVAS